MKSHISYKIYVYSEICNLVYFQDLFLTESRSISLKNAEPLIKIINASNSLVLMKFVVNNIDVAS